MKHHLEPLIDSRQYCLLEKGFYKRTRSSLLEDSCASKEFSRKIRPLMGRKENLIYKHFISNENVFFPSSDVSGKPKFEYYVSLFGGAVDDIALISSIFPQVKLILNEYNPEMYGLYSAVRDYLPSTVSSYERLASTRPKDKSYEYLSSYYNKLKSNYIEYYGRRKVSENAALLMYLLHINGIGSNKKRNYFTNKLQNLKDWSRILKNTQLLNRRYDEVTLPRANTLVYAEPPSNQWNSNSNKEFANFFNNLNINYGEGKSNHRYYLVASSNNPTHHSHFKKKDGWNIKSVGNSEVLVTNYKTDKLKSMKEAVDANYTNAYAYSFDRYCKTLL